MPSLEEKLTKDGSMFATTYSAVSPVIATILMEKGDNVEGSLTGKETIFKDNYE